MKPSKKNYLTSVTHDAYQWPRKVPLLEIPSQPSRKPGIRIYKPAQDGSICVHPLNAIPDKKQPINRVKKIEKDYADVLMSRKKFIDKNLVSKHRKDRFTTTYQIDFVRNVLPYEDLIDQLGKSADQKTMKRKCKIRSDLVDPLPFKRLVDKETVLDTYFSVKCP